jgi:hypothetical protein
MTGPSTNGGILTLLKTFETATERLGMGWVKKSALLAFVVAGVAGSVRYAIDRGAPAPDDGTTRAKAIARADAEPRTRAPARESGRGQVFASPLDADAVALKLRDELLVLDAKIVGKSSRAELRKRLHVIDKKIAKLCVADGCARATAATRDLHAFLDRANLRRLDKTEKAALHEVMQRSLAGLSSAPATAKWLQYVRGLRTTLADSGKSIAVNSPIRSADECKKLGDLIFAQTGIRHVAFFARPPADAGSRALASLKKDASCYYSYRVKKDRSLVVFNPGK